MSSELDAAGEASRDQGALNLCWHLPMLCYRQISANLARPAGKCGSS
jgi:hypothetical protein